MRYRAMQRRAPARFGFPQLGHTIASVASNPCRARDCRSAGASPRHEVVTTSAQIAHAVGTCRRMRQRLLLLTGCLSVLLAAIGAVLPLMPTTVFLLIAAWCFSRASPALHERLRSDQRFGQALRDWEDHGVIRPRAKISALVAMALSWLVVALTSAGPLVPSLVGACLLAAAAFVASRPSRSSDGPPTDG